MAEVALASVARVDGENGEAVAAWLIERGCGDWESWCGCCSVAGVKEAAVAALLRLLGCLRRTERLMQRDWGGRSNWGGCRSVTGGGCRVA